VNFEHDISEEEFLSIERYLRKEMSDLERMQFLLRLNASQSLREKTEASRLMFIGIAEAALEGKLQNFHLDHATKPKAKVFAMKYWAAAAAVLVLIISVTWLLTRPTENEKIYSELFQADPGLITSMGATEDYVFNHAMVDYKSGNYNKAISSWESLRKQSPNSDTLNYFLGVAWMADDKAAESVPFLEKVVSQSESSFREDAVWYLALAYIRLDSKEKAVSLLEKNPSARTNELLSRLKK
jgi:tetratricopeptide (TPR) repeat protein